MCKLMVVAVLLVCECATCESLTHKEVCGSISAAVVRIDTNRPSHGTGFIVSPDGWILTAAHVVIDTKKTLRVDEAITVTLPGGKIEPADEVLPVGENVIKDFAVLKLRSPQTKLPFLELGKQGDIGVGSNVTFVGFPLSTGLKDKFCLSGSVASSNTVTVNIGGKGVNIDVIYLQSPSVKGLSGSPIVADDTGKVVGILTLSLAGISKALSDTNDKIAGGGPSLDVEITRGVSMTDTLRELINVLDNQLANGMGAATGIEDAWLEFRKAKREYDRKKK